MWFRIDGKALKVTLWCSLTPQAVLQTSSWSFKQVLQRRAAAIGSKLVFQTLQKAYQNWKLASFIHYEHINTNYMYYRGWSFYLNLDVMQSFCLLSISLTCLLIYPQQTKSCVKKLTIDLFAATHWGKQRQISP